MDEAAPQAAGSPLGQASEEELVTRAQEAMARAVAAPVGSVARAVRWAAYDTVAAELDRRAARWLAARAGRR
jgi:hypothetical protein